MKSVHVLVANSDRRLNNLIEVAVRDVCYEQVLVEYETTFRLDEVIHLGCAREFGLIVLAPDHVVIGPPQRASTAKLNDAVRAIQTVKQYRDVPLLVVGIKPHDEMALLEAGAAHAFGILFDRDRLRSEIRLALGLAELVEQPEPSRWSLAEGLLRGLQKLRQS
jgi:hypothetical protein